ncbi:hypothetical protein lerEdw1_015177 [Lerista edwardsae]|nr:hypothetical protein lerEdw1_015177 [Lerista edwardsae]
MAVHYNQAWIFIGFSFQKLRFPIFECPRYLELLKETMASSEFQAKIQPYEEFLKEIAVYSGYDLNSLKTLDNFKLWNLQDTLFCEAIHNFTLPEWATEDVRAKLAELATLSLSSVFGIYKRVEKARLQGGLLVKSIVETLADEALNPDKRKLLAYSAVSIFFFKMEAVALCLVRLPHGVEAAEICAELKLKRTVTASFYLLYCHEVVRKKENMVMPPWRARKERKHPIDLDL